MTEPRRVIAGRRTADEWENSVGFFGIGKKKWEEQAKAAQAEAEAQADDVKSALPNSDAEASDRTLAERVNEQQRWENSLRRFVQAESTRMQQEEQKSKDTSDLNVDALKQSAQHSGSSAEPSASIAGEAKTSGSAEGKKTVGASSQAANADAAQTGSFTQEAAQTPDTSAPKRAPQISEYRATSMPADAFETNSSATAVPSSDAASVSGTASVQSEAGSQKQNVQDALKEFNETKYGTEHEGNTSSVSSHADAAAAPSSSAEKDSADIKTPNVEDREREKLAAGVVPTDAEEKPAFVPAPGVESKNSNDKKTANADSKSTLESTPQESESVSDVKASAHEKKSPSPEAQATSGLESSGTPSASKKSDKIEFVGSGATGSAKHLDDRNDPETLAPEKNRSVETSAEKTSAEKMAVQHEKTVADEVSAHSFTDKDSKKQDVENTARDEKASQNGAAAASSHAAASVEGNEKAEVLTPENPLHDLVTAMRGYGSGKVSYELRQLGDDMHYRIFHRGSEVEQGVVVPTDAWFSSIASLYVRAQDAGRVWNRALVVANPSENGLVAVQASYTNTADASSYTTDYILETSEKDSASQKDSSAKSAESAKSSADQSTASTEAAAQKTSTAKTSVLADSADDTSSQKESEAKLAQDKSDEQAKTAESQKAKDLDDHAQDVKSADADKANTQDSQKSEKSEHTVDSEKKPSGAHEKEQEVSAKAKADTAKSDSATAESTKSSSSALAAGTLGAAGVTAAGITSSSKSDREDSRYEYDYDADPQNVTGRHDAQAAEQSKTETDSAKAGAVSEKSEKSAVSDASESKDSSGLSTPEAEVEKTKVEKSSEDEEELNSMQAALATIVASSEAKKTASNAKEDVADTSAAVKTSGTDSKSAADKTSEDSQKAADSESTVKAESDAKTTAGYTSENQSANVTQAVVEESQAGTTSTHSSSALPKHVDDLALVPEVEKDSLTGSTVTKHQESASNKQDALAGQSATAVAAQSETSTADGKTAQHESADLPPAEAEPDTPAHQAHSSVLAGDALAEGNLVLTDAKVIEHLAPVTEALFGENGSAKDATTVLIRVRSVGSYYDVLTHVRRNGFWEQVRTFELVSEEDLGIPTLKADSYSEGEGSPLAMSLTFTPGVPVQSAFDYSNEQAFVRYPRQLEADRYVEELRMFPRLGAKIPAHMANALTHWSM
ncbi:hypothetical protein HMPREF2981_02520 [Rothia sp. HMSC069C01]|uniref:hypothetical protein n=1 Tax=Rothia sp. HMSC069C01 TaxID=1739485 RepID=UPI0008A2AEC1|nr:hypothetical protein [Rothia sp. HMSC069C01]OFP55710.1 hypothetical protein HMPREF2981_02520 [Rothia sp. HMSC069C01]